MCKQGRKFYQYINDDNIIYFSFSVTTYKFLKLQYYLRAVWDNVVSNVFVENLDEFLTANNNWKLQDQYVNDDNIIYFFFILCNNL